MRRIVSVLVLILATAPLAFADTLYLRDGRTLRGTMLGMIGGRIVFRINQGNLATGSSGSSSTSSTAAARPDGEIQFFRTRDIERLEIDGRSLDEARFDTRTVEVSLGANWIDSGVDLRRGERVQVRASGTIVAGRTRITPDGLRSTDPTAPLPRAAEGVLIGSIGNDPNAPIMELGLGRDFVADRDGRLYLTSNRGTYTDARGAFAVEIRRERNFTSRRNNTSTTGTRDDDDDNDVFGGTDDRRIEPAPTRPRTPTGTTIDDTTNVNRNRTTREITVTVPGNSRGMDTGLELAAGDQVTITATGQIVAGRRAGSVPPEGGRAGLGAVFGGTYPFPQAGPGALIGYIRLANGQTSAPFLVGSQVTFNAPVDGRLFLLINDDNYSDNSGSFTARIRQN
ncbi:MAG TPA: hypothetical protein VGB73_00880 [Pyrinomonadaceae bacterium]|jgi:hypothetical protein